MTQLGHRRLIATCLIRRPQIGVARVTGAPTHVFPANSFSTSSISSLVSPALRKSAKSSRIADQEPRPRPVPLGISARFTI